MPDQKSTLPKPAPAKSDAETSNQAREPPRSRSEAQLADLINHKCYCTAILDRLSLGLFALDGDGGLLFNNACADQMLRRGDLLLVQNRRLSARNQRDARTLLAAIDKAATQASARSIGKAEWLKVERGIGAPYVVLVAALDCQVTPTPKLNAAVLIIVYDLERKFNVLPDVLQKLLGLTRTEARLACALAVGRGLEGAARALDIRVNTARAHLRSIFLKLNLKRQQELLLMMVSLTMLEPFERGIV